MRLSLYVGGKTSGSFLQVTSPHLTERNRHRGQFAHQPVPDPPANLFSILLSDVKRP